MSLQEVMKSNVLAEAVFKALAMRDRFRQVTDLRRLYNEVDKLTQGNASPEAFQEVVRNMEKAGLGRFVAGRKNNPDRFKWANKGVAKAVREGKLDEAKIPVKAQEKPIELELETTPKEVFQEAIGVITSHPTSYLNIKIPLSIPLDSLQHFISMVKTLQ